MVSGRALHFVFKIGDRALTSKFYREVLGMQVLRHEEFSKGCEATCNGPYDNAWSKTMIGYGSENNHFVIELTYNYGINAYERGNDFCGITIRSEEVIRRARRVGWPLKQENGQSVLEAPGGYKYYIINEPQPTDKDPVEKISLSVSNLKRSVSYWNGILGLKIYSETDTAALLGFADNQVKLELKHLDVPIQRGEAYGRIAFSCPREEQPEIDEKMREANEQILTPLTILDTPGKASVRVLILADPDGHEICFVEDEGYRVLSQSDVNAAELLDKSMLMELARKK